MTLAFAKDNLEQMSLKDFTEKAYLDYSMYVILDRALPNLCDGLKPVQRRIIYAMSELGLKSTSKYKKSARTVGDVLGKFHPHGDSACYEAMVLMAQNFTYRYPYVDGQGNWGSIDDPKSFAAMRYTEAKLAKFTDTLLAELGQGTVDWVPNFDGTLKEPSLLPAQLPNLLLNGAQGIAVGMATDIPPHNLSEIGSALVALLDNSKLKLSDIMKHVKGPDYPTGAEIITPKADIKRIYSSGTGSVKQRAIWERDGNDIVITALPHQVSASKILEQIASQIQAKKLPMVTDLRDESDHENPVRLVIIPRSNRIDYDALLLHLFASTDLERSYRVNLNMIGIDGRPQVKNILEILTEWLEFRKTTVKRRLQFRLDKILDRLHILDALMAAYLNIDEVIEIIRHDENPKKKLMKRFKLSEIQADAILDMKLRHLAKLEEVKIKGEKKELAKERKVLEEILGSSRRLRTLIKTEITALLEEYGDKRRSKIVVREEAKAMKAEDRVPSEPVTVILSQKGWVKAAKGHDIDTAKLSYKSGDDFMALAKTKSTKPAIIFDSTGRVYNIPCHTLPSARGYGEPVTKQIKAPTGASFVNIFPDDVPFVLVGSNAGYGFIVKGEELLVKNKNGKGVLNLPKERGRMLTPAPIQEIEGTRIAVVSSEGRLLIFKADDLPQLAKGKGNKLYNISKAMFESGEEELISMHILQKKDSLKIHCGKRHTTIKAKDLDYYVGERAQRGHKLPRGYQKVTEVEVLPK